MKLHLRPYGRSVQAYSATRTKSAAYRDKSRKSNVKSGTSVNFSNSGNLKPKQAEKSRGESHTTHKVELEETVSPPTLSTPNLRP